MRLGRGRGFHGDLGLRLGFCGNLRLKFRRDLGLGLRRAHLGRLGGKRGHRRLGLGRLDAAARHELLLGDDNRIDIAGLHLIGGCPVGSRNLAEGRQPGRLSRAHDRFRHHEWRQVIGCRRFAVGVRVPWLVVRSFGRDRHRRIIGWRLIGIRLSRRRRLIVRRRVIHSVGPLIRCAKRVIDLARTTPPTATGTTTTAAARPIAFVTLVGAGGDVIGLLSALGVGIVEIVIRCERVLSGRHGRLRVIIAATAAATAAALAAIPVVLLGAFGVCFFGNLGSTRLGSRRVFGILLARGGTLDLELARDQRGIDVDAHRHAIALLERDQHVAFLVEQIDGDIGTAGDAQIAHLAGDALELDPAHGLQRGALHRADIAGAGTVRADARAQLLETRAQALA